MPKIVDQQKYRTELLARCFDVFAEKGYSTLTMRELAEQLSVSTGTLYHYWSGKQELFDQLVAFLAEQDRARFLQAAGQPKSLKKRIDAMLSFVAANEDYFLKQHLIMMDYFRQHGRKAVLNNQLIQRSNKLFRKSLSEFLGIDDQEIVVFILDFLVGVVIGRTHEGDFVSIERQGKLLNKMLKLYLAKGNES